jgi:hypothetical protein
MCHQTAIPGFAHPEPSLPRVSATSVLGRDPRPRSARVGRGVPGPRRGERGRRPASVSDSLVGTKPTARSQPGRRPPRDERGPRIRGGTFRSPRFGNADSMTGSRPNMTVSCRPPGRSRETSDSTSAEPSELGSEPAPGAPFPGPEPEPGPGPGAPFPDPDPEPLPGPGAPFPDPAPGPDPGLPDPVPDPGVPYPVPDPGTPYPLPGIE